jgi:hypothetical protein
LHLLSLLHNLHYIYRLETYQIIKKRGHKIYSNWKRSGQHNGDLKTKEGNKDSDMTGSTAFAKSIYIYLGITDWCLSYYDGCKWAMYMAFQFEVLHFENLGRDFPGEWMSADLGIPLADDARAKLRQEYKRKMDEDNVRVKKQRQATKLNGGSQEKHSAEKELIPSFDYGHNL